MTKVEFLTVMEYMYGCYPSESYTPETLEEYWSVLGDLDHDELMANVKRIIRSEVTIPSAGDIRELVLWHRLENGS